jgi:hypothetical protein
MGNKRLLGASVAVAATLGTMATLAAPANADTRYATIAFAPATGAFGWVQQAHSALQADNLAMGYCAQVRGTDCQRVVGGNSGASEAKGNFCAALVASRPQADRYSWAVGDGLTEAEAEGAALSKLGDGKVLVSVCAGFGGEPSGRGGVAQIAPPPAAPAPAPAPPAAIASQYKTATVTGDVDIYDVPGGEGKVIGMLEGGEGQHVQAKCRDDSWCEVSGKGWVWGDFLKF